MPTEITRRDLLGLGIGAGVAVALGQAGCRAPRHPTAPPTCPEPHGVLANDVHSGLNSTRVGSVVRPSSTEEVSRLIRSAGARGESISVAGGRHAAGRQQFLTGGTLLDMRGMTRVSSLDVERGIVEAEAGIFWPDLMSELGRRQAGDPQPWGIIQKQGIDRMSLGGSLAANMHGNALTEPPFVAQVESIQLVDPTGELRECSRTRNPELFALVAGGYGLFGVVTSVRLRLARRRHLLVKVRKADADQVTGELAAARAAGALYGDWHYNPDPSSDGFLREGVLATHGPDAPLGQACIDPAPLGKAWMDLVILAHRSPGQAYALWSAAQLARNGTAVASDTFQLDLDYRDGYHREVDRALASTVPASESLFELFVPQPSLASFLTDARTELLRAGTAPLYGTVRFIERDVDSYLPWASVPRAGLVVNFHVTHDEPGLAQLRSTFRTLADVALAHDGTYYLTYHPFATRSQVERAHPRVRAFLAEKSRRDPRGVLSSDWERSLRSTLAS